MSDHKKENKINIDIQPDVASGSYSNLAIITHAPTEFILDFAQLLPGNNNAQVRSRIIMNPFHAKQLLAALNDNISRYERSFGTIEPPKPQLDIDAVPYDIIGKA